VNQDAPTEGGSLPATRRRWLDALLGGSLVAWAAAVIYPILRYLTPPRDAGGADKTVLTDEQKKEIESARSVIVPLASDRVIVFEQKSGKLSALSAVCTHEGCTVQYLPADALIWCACHNGKYSLDGRVISGPPPRPLAAYEVDGSLDKTVTVEKPGGAA
jgi:cytochrome b6-f complex iron-sulfur subunit